MVRIRPAVGAGCRLPLDLQITDVTVRPRPQQWRNGKPRRGPGGGGDRVCVYVCGTTSEGFGVALEVADFKPYVFIRVPEAWEAAELESFLATLNRAHVRGGAERMTGQLLRRFHAVGYRPGSDGQPFRFNFVKLEFPTLRLRDSVCGHFKAAPVGTRRPGNDAMWTGLLRAMGKPHSAADLKALGDEVFTLHHDQIPHAQAFMNTVGVSASAWLRVEGGTLVAATNSPHKFSGMQIEVQGARVADLSALERSDMAPMVILSFDIESYSESREFPKWWKPEDKIINVGMNFATCAGATKTTTATPSGGSGGGGVKAASGDEQPGDGDDGDGILRTVLCLGHTGHRDDVHISTFDTEAELLSAFQQRVSDPALDPDILLGYNIFDFDFMYLAQRAALIRLMRELRQKPWPEVEARWRDTRKKVVAFEGYLDSYRACSLSDGKGRKALLQRIHSIFNTRGSRLPSLPTEPMLLNKYETSEELAVALAYFGGQPTTTFNSCSRLSTDVCELTIHTLESSAMGSNELRRFDMPGRVCLDLWLHLKNGNSKLSNYSLSSVSQHFLGMDKADMPYTQLFDFYASGDPEKRAEIAEYCSRDCDLPILLVNKLGTVSDLVEMSRVCRTPLPALTTRGQQVKVYSQLAFEVECAGAVLNTVSIAPPTTYVGATVIDPKPGYHDLPVATLDFASLYPSIMQANNIGPGSYVLPREVETVRRMAAEGKIDVTVISTASDCPKSAIANLHAKQRGDGLQSSQSDSPRSPGTDAEAAAAAAAATTDASTASTAAGDGAGGAAKCDDTTHLFVASTTYKGLVPKLLSKLLQARSEVKKQMKTEKDKFKYGMLNSKQLAIKISCNSVYGFFGVKAGYLPCWPVAACTTATGRRYIDQTKEAVETKYTTANGYPGDAEVVYGDTDSVMVKFHGVARSMDGMRQAWKLAEEAADFVSDVTFAEEKEIVLEAEKVYWPYMIWDTKKRYIGRCFMHPERPPKIDAKGVELVRRDNAKLVRDIYGRLVEAIMPLEGAARSVEETRVVVERHLEQELKRIVNNKLPLSDYVITKSLKTGYKSDHLPHVQLVKKIVKRIEAGELVREPPKSGQRIPYVIVQGKGQVYERAEDPTMLEEDQQAPKQQQKASAKARPKLDRLYYLEQQLKNALTKLTMYFHTAAKVFRDAEGAVKRQQGGNHSITNFFSAAASGSPASSSSSSSSSSCSNSPASTGGAGRLDDNEAATIVAKRPRSAKESQGVADKIAARLARAAASGNVPATKRGRGSKSSTRGGGKSDRPPTARASKRKIQTPAMFAGQPSKAAAAKKARGEAKKKRHVLDWSSDEDDEEDDEDGPLDCGAEDDFHYVEPTPMEAASVTASRVQKAKSEAEDDGEEGEEEDDDEDEDDDGGEEGEEDDDGEEEQEEEEEEQDPLDPKALEATAREWFFRARTEILYPAATMLDQIKFFLSAPLAHAAAAVGLMKQSRKAAAEEVDFWTALVEARTVGDIKIPTAAVAEAETTAAQAAAAAHAAAEAAEAEQAPDSSTGGDAGSDGAAAAVGPRHPPGTRVAVYWPLDEEWYTGTLGAFDAVRNVHSITYDDDEQAWLDLRVEDIKMVAPVTGGGGGGGGAGAGTAAGSASAEEEEQAAAAPEVLAEALPGAATAPEEGQRPDEAKLRSGVASQNPPAASGSGAGESQEDMLAAHMALHAEHVAAECGGKSGGQEEAPAQPRSPAASESALPAAPSAAESAEVTLERKVTPTTVTAGTEELAGAGAAAAEASKKTGRSRSMQKVLESLKQGGDVAKLNEKYTSNVSAAAALAATIAAYAEADADEDEAAAAAMKRKQKAEDEAALEEQFELGDLDFDDDGDL